MMMMVRMRMSILTFASLLPAAFYSYIPHFPSPAPSFLISLYPYCISGKLVSQGLHDPAGTALQYLTNGAPFVLGALWDVTDRDIDKMSISCMQAILDPGRSGNPPSGSKTPSKSSKGKSIAFALPGDSPLSMKNNCSITDENVICNGNDDTGHAHAHGNGADVNAALGVSRGVCKMRYIVGAAPVIYGFPVPMEI